MGLQRTLNRSLQNATNRVGQALLRLGTGYAVNGIQDGATKVAQLQSLQGQARGLQQAYSNVTDAQGFTQKSDETLSAMMQISFDLRELAQRATDDGITDNEREDLQSQAESLLEDLQNYAQEAEYNSTKLLDGSFGTKTVQAGITSGAQVNFSLGDARSITLGRLTIISNTASLTTSAIGAGGAVSINGVIIAGSSDDGVSTASASGSALAKANAINSYSDQTGVYAETLGTTEYLYFSYTGSTFTGTLSGETFKINNVSITGSSLDTDNELINAINSSSSSTGVVASLSSTGVIELFAADGRNIHISVSNAATQHFWDAIDITQNVALVGNVSVISNGTTNTNVGGIRLWSSEQIRVEGTAVASELGIAAANYSLTGGTAVQFIDLSTSTEAEQAVKTLDATIEQISSLRANVAAIHSRLDSNASRLVENVLTTESTIQNAFGTDYAVETANLVYNQLVQNSSLASLIQANVSRVTVSKLLGGG